MEGIQLRPLAEKLNLDKSNVSRRLAQAADGGYVRNLEDKRGKPGRWVIGDPLPEAADLLPDPAQLRNGEQPPDKDRCGVAPVPDGKEEQALFDCCQICGKPELHNPVQQRRGTCGPCSITTIPTELGTAAS
jgi:hypothetical protein